MGKFLRLINGYARHQDEAGATTIYDQAATIGSTITAGTPYTLPASGSYNSTELMIYFNGVVLDDGPDYSYVGSVPRTQVSFTFDLLAGDIVRFYIGRAF